MITRLRLANFKSFDAGGHEIPLGSLALMVGTNASGKSNHRDALRFLHGVGRGYTLPEILGAKYGEGGERLWAGIRGGARELVHGAKGGKVSVECDVRWSTTTMAISRKRPVRRVRAWVLRYKLELLISGKLKRKVASVANESLHSSSTPIFSTFPDVLKATQPGDGKQLLVRIKKPGGKKYIGPTMKLRNDQPLLSQLASHPEATATTQTACRALISALSSMRFLDLEPQALRRPSLPGQDVLGDKGENLSSVLQELCKNELRKESLIEWTRELTPLDVEDIEFKSVSLDGKIQLALKEAGGRLITAESASDGTLRFLAFAAALLGTKPAGTYVFEEIENGIHPNRVHLLLELLQQATGEGKTQVIATTHSPALLNFLRGRSLESALLVTRSGDSSRVRQLKDLPIADGDLSMAGDLLESGWFENVTEYLNAADDEIGGEGRA
jgi:predicted ATPase